MTRAVQHARRVAEAPHGVDQTVTPVTSLLQQGMTAAVVQPGLRTVSVVPHSKHI
jgi:hypothetical protein